jgi:hypothetical protein
VRKERQDPSSPWMLSVHSDAFKLERSAFLTSSSSAPPTKFCSPACCSRPPRRFPNGNTGRCRARIAGAFCVLDSLPIPKKQPGERTSEGGTRIPTPSGRHIRDDRYADHRSGMMAARFGEALPKAVGTEFFLEFWLRRSQMTFEVKSFLRLRQVDGVNKRVDIIPRNRSGDGGSGCRPGSACSHAQPRRQHHLFMECQQYRRVPVSARFLWHSASSLARVPLWTCSPPTVRASGVRKAAVKDP